MRQHQTAFSDFLSHHPVESPEAFGEIDRLIANDREMTPHVLKRLYRLQRPSVALRERVQDVVRFSPYAENFEEGFRLLAYWGKHSEGAEREVILEFLQSFVVAGNRRAGAAIVALAAIQGVPAESLLPGRGCARSLLP